MEVGLAYLTASQSTTSALCFSNRNSFINKNQFLLPVTSDTSTAISVCSKRRKPICVKASESSFDAKTTRQTLASNWDVEKFSSFANSAPTLPKFEELDTTNMLLRQRIIFLGSQVDDVTADFVISQLLFLDAEDPKKDIKLFINSPGGSVTAGLGIYDAMKLCKADAKRFCMPNGRVMIHQPLGTAGGKASEMSIRIREMSYHKIKLNKILSRITGKPLEQVEIDTDRDNFMNAWEAKEYGLVDEVIDDGKPGLVAPLTDASPPPKTRVWDLWKIEGTKKAKNNLPSEHKMLQNGYVGGGGEDKDMDQEKEAPSPV
ncbi:hypothetical protein OIU76_029560 [Salix suchowensis]|nr:hypothetical protein OIU76_029560 [Salix suchowensis]